MTLRELTGSKGRAALGTGVAGIIILVLQQVQAIENPNVAIAVIAALTLVAVAYIRYTGLEDQAKHQASGESSKASTEASKASTEASTDSTEASKDAGGK